MDFMKSSGSRGPVKGGSFWLWVAVTALLAAAQACAQSSGKVAYQTFSEDQLKSDYEALLASDAAWKALVDGAVTMGFTPTTRWSNAQWGIQRSLNLGGEAVTVTWYVFDLDQLGSPDAAALQYISDGVHTYRALDIAQNRDPNSMQEYTVVNHSGNYGLKSAPGFWACLKSGLRSACGESCGPAISSCNQAADLSVGAFSLAAYLGCLSDSCDSCLASQAVSCAMR